MNPPELTLLARQAAFDAEASFQLRLAFGIACIERVRHLLTDRDVIGCFEVGMACLRGTATDVQLRQHAEEAAQLATAHQGSGSLDGSGNAAVSASRGVAAALAGRALEAAEYAAYAKVYSYASYAVTDPANYTEEHAWQVAKLRELIEASTNDTGR